MLTATDTPVLADATVPQLVPGAGVDPETAPTMGSRCPKCGSHATWGAKKKGATAARRGCNDCGHTWIEQV